MDQNKQVVSKTAAIPRKKRQKPPANHPMLPGMGLEETPTEQPSGHPTEEAGSYAVSEDAGSPFARTPSADNGPESLLQQYYAERRKLEKQLLRQGGDKAHVVFEAREEMDRRLEEESGYEAMRDAVFEHRTHSYRHGPHTKSPDAYKPPASLPATSEEQAAGAEPRKGIFNLLGRKKKQAPTDNPNSWRGIDLSPKGQSWKKWWKDMYTGRVDTPAWKQPQREEVGQPEDEETVEDGKWQTVNPIKGEPGYKRPLWQRMAVPARRKLRQVGKQYTNDLRDFYKNVDFGSTAQTHANSFVKEGNGRWAMRYV